ncbi:MAG: group 1 truncated hemoglobin [bacterium]|nr:group 1 truncated hemoglobin [bacterium]
MKTTKIILGTAFCIAFFLSACKKETKTEEPAATAPTLYERVGGTKMVADPNQPSVMIETGRLTLRAVVDSAILVIAGDARLAKFFPVLFAELGAGNSTGLMALSKNFTDFLCLATGCKNSAYAYTGKSMKDAHNPATHNRMGVKANAAEFDIFVGDIGIGLAKNGVTAANNKQLVDDLVALLYTTKADIVQN